MKSPRFDLGDGTYALMHAIVQTANYRRGYVEEPSDAEEEVRRLAKLQIPSEWRSAPLLLLSAGKTTLAALMKSKNQPAVMCVGEFVFYRGGVATTGKPVFRYVAWLQEELEPHMDARNRELFRLLDWDRAP